MKYQRIKEKSDKDNKHHKYQKKSSLRDNRMLSIMHMIFQQDSIMDSTNLPHIPKIPKLKFRNTRKIQVLSRKRNRISSVKRHLRRKVKSKIKDLISTLEGTNN